MPWHSVRDAWPAQTVRCAGWTASDNALVAESIYLRVGIAQLGKNVSGVLAQRRDGVHARFECRAGGRRNKRRDGSSGAIHLPPSITLRKLRMVPDVAHGVDPGIGDAGSFEAVDDLRARQAGKRRDNQ